MQRKLIELDEKTGEAAESHVNFGEAKQVCQLASTSGECLTYIALPAMAPLAEDIPLVYGNVREGVSTVRQDRLRIVCVELLRAQPTVLSAYHCLTCATVAE